VLDLLSVRLRRWILSQLAAMAIIGLMVGCIMWAIGVPAAGALGLLGIILATPRAIVALTTADRRPPTADCHRLTHN